MRGATGAGTLVYPGSAKMPVAVFAELSLRRWRSFLKFLNSLQPFGLLILRIALGVIFFTHGYPKLAHAAGPMQSMFVQHGLPAQFVYVAGVLETFGGLLLILGLFARGAALLLAIEMCVAILKVHSAHGIMAVHDYEFPLALAAGSLALATIGAGAVSVDRFLFAEGGGASRSRSKPSK
jgi:putative oxidoreductase